MTDRKNGTKQNITYAALDFFSQKGFTETSMREIAAAVGVNASSMYNHFKSKASILDDLLEDYRQYAGNLTPPAACWSRLTADATVEDVLGCFIIYFPKDEEAYYLKMITLLFQEQCRNRVIQEFVANNLILWQERYVADILNRLVEVGALRPDIDIDFWAKTHANLNYTFTGRYVLGIGDTQPQYEGKNIEEMIRAIYQNIFRLHGRISADA